MKQDIEVTVYCLVYNHEKYLRDALEGFVSQKTSFRYKVVVHDDASKDNSAAIIREYQSRYPDVIFPIIQIENQYSKGISPLYQYIAPIIEGKYVATCEGDDYWCDNNKLQKQYDYMESHKNCSACVHNTLYYDVRTGNKYNRFPEDCSQILDKRIVFQGGGRAFHTSSLFMRREYVFTPPELSVKYSGDYPRAVFLAIKGDIYYFKDVMSVYRMNVPGSWSMTNSQIRQIDTLEAVISMLDNADRYSEYKYHTIIEEIIREKRFDLLVAEKKNKEAIRIYHDIFRKLSNKTKIDLWLSAYVRPLYEAIIRIINWSKKNGNKTRF